MGAVWQDVKAPLVPDELVAGEPDVALFRDEAHQQRPHQRHRDTRGGKDSDEISEGIYHPDGAHRLTGLIEGGLGTQPDGVDEHPIKVPGGQADGDIELPFALVPIQQPLQFFPPAVLQLGDLLRELKHGPALPSSSAVRPARGRPKRIRRQRLRTALCC